MSSWLTDADAIATCLGLFKPSEWVINGHVPKQGYFSVKCSSLAQQIDPKYLFFRLYFRDLLGLNFVPDWRITERESEVWDLTTHHYGLHLEPLYVSANPRTGEFSMTCNTDHHAYGGGWLSFAIAALQVRDQGGNPVSLATLQALKNAL